MNILYTYFGQKELLEAQRKEHEKYPHIRLIYVDDCSPEPLGKLDYADVYRIDTDKKWNQGGARNLGMSVVDDWTVMVDMDYLVTEENMKELESMEKDVDTIYYLGRKGEEPSYTIYLIHSEGFKKIGGYDEDFCGHYGYEDTEFNWRAKQKVSTENRFNIDLDYIHGHATEGNRDIARNRAMMMDKISVPGDGKQLRFKWHKI